jgi:hypothetical protein
MRRRLAIGLLLRRGLWLRPLALTAVAAFAPDLCHVSTVAADGLAAFAPDVGHVLAIFADRRSAFASDLCHVSAITADRLASFATDSRHMATILAHCLATFSPRFSGLLGRKLVRPALDVSGFSPLACDLALPLLIHRGETAPRSFRHDDALLICQNDERQTRCLYVSPCTGSRCVKCSNRLQMKQPRGSSCSGSSGRRSITRFIVRPVHRRQMEMGFVLGARLV